MARPRLFILSGPPFAGKSTIARAMEARFGLERIEIDEVHRDRGLDIATDAAWRIAFQRSFRRLHDALGRGESAVWDSASLTRRQRDRIRAAGDRYGAETHLIYVAASDDERNRRRLRNLTEGTRPDVPEPAFREAGASYEIPVEDERPIRFTPDVPVDEWLETTIAPLMGAAGME